MAKKGDYSIGSIYAGGPSSFTPSYGNIFSGYGVSAGDISMGTDARTANVVKEISNKLNMGLKAVEASQVSPEVFDSIPIGQLREVNRVAKLVGAEVTLHAPVIEPSGVGQNGFDETQRQAIERQMQHAIDRANELNPDGSSPVTFHASAQLPGSVFKPTKEGFGYRKMIAVDRETGQMTPLEEERLFYPAREIIKKGATREEVEKVRRGELKAEEFVELQPVSDKGKIFTPENRLRSLNATKWDNSISQVLFNKERADEILQNNQVQIMRLLPGLQSGTMKMEDLTPNQKQAYFHYKNAEAYLEDTDQHLRALFHKAYKFGDNEQKKLLKNLSEEYVKELKENGDTPFGQSQSMQKLILELKKPNLTPRTYVSVEDFAVDKSSETFANVAFHSWKEYKDKAPIISIENPPAGGALSTGEDLRNLVEATQKKFIDKAVAEGVMSESEARKQAEKLIGVTWDVGHINMLRKQGFKDEALIKETEKVAKLVKHVHLSDNFGMEHTELPMGMGNVPVKEMMEKIGQEGFKGKKVIEALQWWQHFSPQGSPMQSPLVPTMEALGSPVYSEGAGVGPYWNQATGFQQGYPTGLGMMIPSGNYEMFGAGFSMALLPTELGGQRPGAQGSRMSGRGME